MKRIYKLKSNHDNLLSEQFHQLTSHSFPKVLGSYQPITCPQRFADSGYFTACELS